MRIFDDSYKKKVSIFVDESTSNNHLCFGTFFIYDEKMNKICKQLKEIRDKHNCNSDITYKKLTGHISSGRVQTSMEWAKSLIKQDNRDFHFDFHKIDYLSPYFEINRFSKEHHKYNYFLQMCLKSILHKKIRNRIVVARIILHQRGEPEETQEDPYNKKNYLLKYVSEFDVDFENLTVVESSAEIDKASISEDECNLLQLTDLLLGASYNAIHGASEKDGKYHVSTILSHIIQKTGSYFPNDSAYRNFNFSCFPGKGGGFDKIVKVKIPPYNLDIPRINKNLNEFFNDTSSQ